MYLLGITKLALGPLGSIDRSNLTSPSNSTLGTYNPSVSKDSPRGLALGSID